MTDLKIARLTGVSRGFGGDNAYYTGPDGEEIVVAVSWALLNQYHTWVSHYRADSKAMNHFYDNRYVEPDEALRRSGYEPDVHIDFCDPDSWLPYELLSRAPDQQP